MQGKASSMAFNKIGIGAATMISAGMSMSGCVFEGKFGNRCFQDDPCADVQNFPDQDGPGTEKGADVFSENDTFIIMTSSEDTRRVAEDIITEDIIFGRDSRITADVIDDETEDSEQAPTDPEEPTPDPGEPEEESGQATQDGAEPEDPGPPEDLGLMPDTTESPIDNGEQPDEGPPACIPKTEICDEEDNDCDGEIDEDFAVGEECTETCGLDSLYVCAEDGSIVCKNFDKEPIELENCWPGDENCDGFDETQQECAEDCDDDGFSDIQEGEGSCGFNAICDPQVNPKASEICDSKDNDCDGFIDRTAGEAGQTAIYACANETFCFDNIDNDGDGFFDETDTDCQKEQ